jgi:DNA repair protein RadC
LSGQTSETWQCPQCGYIAQSNDELTPDAFFRPWHVVHGRAGVKAYVESLGEEAHEWLLALYVDAGLQLLAVDTVARGDVAGCDVPFWKLINRGHELKAAGFILVHNHPSGDPTPSHSDIRMTARLYHASRDLEMPLLAHLIIAGDEITQVGW